MLIELEKYRPLGIVSVWPNISGLLSLGLNVQGEHGVSHSHSYVHFSTEGLLLEKCQG